MPAVVLAMVLGAFLGELLHLEKRIGSAAGSTRGLINNKSSSTRSGIRS